MRVVHVVDPERIEIEPLQRMAPYALSQMTGMALHRRGSHLTLILRGAVSKETLLQLYSDSDS